MVHILVELCSDQMAHHQIHNFYNTETNINKNSNVSYRSDSWTMGPDHLNFS